MVIFLHGDDTYRSREKLRALTGKFLREVDPSGANLVTIDGTTAVASEIWGAVAAQSFLVRKRMVVVEGLGEQKSAAVREEVAGFLARIPDDAIMVFYEAASRRKTFAPRSFRGVGENTERRTAKRSAKSTAKAKAAAPKSDVLFTALFEGKYVEEFAPLEGAALAAWVRECVAACGTTIAPDALAALIGEVGPNLWRMENEIEKLVAAAAGAGAPAIAIAHVRDLVLPTPSEDVFAFIDAVGSGNRPAAIRALERLEAARVDPFPLVGLIARQVRLLASAVDCLRRGIAPSALAAELGVQPFVARKIGEHAQRFTPAAIRALHVQLVELDAKLKSSRAPWPVLLECFALDATRERTPS